MATPPPPAHESIASRALVPRGIGRRLALAVIAVVATIAVISEQNAEPTTLEVSSEQALPLLGETTTTAPTTISTSQSTASTATTALSTTTTTRSTTTTTRSTTTTTASTSSTESLAPTTFESPTSASTTTTEAPTTSPPTTIETTTTTASGGGCDPNYSGCVPIASDVDCAGGSGNGPAYVTGPVQVIGQDIYGLDADNDGIGCENG